jgi:hypothetical protein
LDWVFLQEQVALTGHYTHNALLRVLRVIAILRQQLPKTVR